MRDKGLYAQLPGIRSLWFVRDVELRLQAGEVLVLLDRELSGVLTCPVCGEVAPGYDACRRRWRHLDACQYRTVIEAEIPRVECAVHGVHQIHVSWAEPSSHFTASFEARAIDWFKEARLSGAGRLLKLSWDEPAGIQQRAVRRGFQRRQLDPPTRLGVDETSFQKRHEYATVVSDSVGGDVLYMADDRDQASLEGHYATLSPRALAEIASVCMDMWQPYIQATLAFAPGAAEKIAFDELHVAKHLGDAVNAVRRGEHRGLLAMGCTKLTRVAVMLERHLEGIVTAVAQRAAAGINASIQAIKRKACGFHNRERFRLAIYFHLGGLDLYPAAARPS